jgi:hypothetical protein
MRLPTRTLNYTFESDNGTLWNAEKSRTIDNVKIFSISFGPSFTLWPQKNIFLQITPEVNVGFQNNGDETILKTFTLFPSLASKIGLRFGKVYLSGTYGLIFKKFEVDKSSPFAEETDAIKVAQLVRNKLESGYGFSVSAKEIQELNLSVSY